VCEGGVAFIGLHVSEYACGFGCVRVGGGVEQMCSWFSNVLCVCVCL